MDTGIFLSPPLHPGKSIIFNSKFVYLSNFALCLSQVFAMLCHAMLYYYQECIRESTANTLPYYCIFLRTLPN